jgi:predicted ABC-type ATPase
MIEQLSVLLGTAQPIFFLLAGPNGAGKSTFRRHYVEPAGLPCVDPDAVARAKYGREPKTKAEAIAASAEATEIVRAKLKERISVGLETVFSDTKGLKLALLTEAMRLGYRTGVIFIGLDDQQLSIARVQDRVDVGGHDVPDELIVQRFPRSYQNLRNAIPLSDFVLFVDNSRETRHRIFGSITREDGLRLWDDVPRWYEAFIA